MSIFGASSDDEDIFDDSRSMRGAAAIAQHRRAERRLNTLLAAGVLLFVGAAVSLGLLLTREPAPEPVVVSQAP